jgi:hypothetical protein
MQARMTQFLLGEYFVYLSLCNPQKALALIEAPILNQRTP